MSHQRLQHCHFGPLRCSVVSLSCVCWWTTVACEHKPEAESSSWIARDLKSYLSQQWMFLFSNLLLLHTSSSGCSCNTLEPCVCLEAGEASALQVAHWPRHSFLKRKIAPSTQIRRCKYRSENPTASPHHWDSASRRLHFVSTATLIPPSPPSPLWCLQQPTFSLSAHLAL